MRLPPCVLHEDEHLLVVHKPAGWNTHAPSPYAGAGIYEWLRDREPRWASLAIVHRLDKETSGVLVFAKTPLANRALTGQFTRHEVGKRYLLLTDRPVPAAKLQVETAIEPRFQEHFVAANAIPHASDAFPRLAAVVTLPEVAFNAGQGGRRRRR